MKRLYLYSLGEGAPHSPNQICCAVPKKTTENEIFFGPCMAKLREKLFKDYLKDIVNAGKESFLFQDEIYLAGISSTAKGLPRKLLWTGKIKELTTFRGAWVKIKSSKENTPFTYIRSSHKIVVP